jgi:pimeloyl-ACP methyl ester carboxylesterase
VSLSYHSAELRRCEELLRLGGLHTRTDGWLGANVAFIKGEGYCVSGRVGEIDVPCLVVYGEEDRILPSKENAARFLNDIGAHRVTVVAVPDAGHSPHIEAAGEVARAVEIFVGGLAGAAEPPAAAAGAVES